MFLYRRTLDQESVLVALNFSSETRDLNVLNGKTLLSSLNDQPQAHSPLRPNEARIVLNS